MADKSYGRPASSNNPNEPVLLRDVGDDVGQGGAPAQTRYAEVVGKVNKLLGTQNIAATVTSATALLTQPCVAANFYADGADMAIRLGVGAQVAVATDAFIKSGTSVEFSLDRVTQTDIGVVCVSGSGTLRITRLG